MPTRVKGDVNAPIAPDRLFACAVHIEKSEGELRPSMHTGSRKANGKWEMNPKNWVHTSSSFCHIRDSFIKSHWFIRRTKDIPLRTTNKGPTQIYIIRSNNLDGLNRARDVKN